MRGALEEDRAGRAGVFARIAQRAKIAVEDMRQRHALRRELADCDMRGSLDETLADIGVSRAQVAPLVKGAPNAARLLTRMAAWVGVDLEGIRDPALRRELQRVCTLCRSQGHCKHWLDHPDSRGYRDFCPNAELLDELRPRRRE
jgi:uncharacterized protein YjiS (DUF1127 family)